MAKQKNKRRILLRYSIVAGILLLFSAWISYDLFITTVVKAERWNQRSRKEMSKLDTIHPERGSILASNGNILACNVKVYDIMLDLRHEKIISIKNINWKSVDSLADSLDLYYPRISNFSSLSKDSAEKYSWHTKLRKELQKDPNRRNRALRIAAKKGKEDFEKIRNFPFLKTFRGKGFRIPIYTNEKYIRLNPYGNMAKRSIGRVSEYKGIHGYSGLEMALDSLLYGKPGLAKKVTLTNGIANWVETPSIPGYDILTTIDIDIQDILEEELLKVCQESKAEWGTAIIMEVATGEIRAISNLELLDDNSYGEAMNRAVQAFEPGSVMKPISLMIAFEDGLVKSVEETVDCSPFQRTRDPHAPSVKNMKQVIEMSSNTGIARVIFRGYSNRPEAFYDRLDGIGFFEPMQSGIGGAHTPRIRRLVDHNSKGEPITLTARHLDLARQAYGYNTEIPPLYTLSIYNALANDGKYVRPHLVRGLRDSNGYDSILPISYIRPRICSPETAAKVRECIREVVWGKHGTARLVQDDRVEIAGKTGTAYPVEAGIYNTAKRRYAFASFFPYSSPKYSCMVLILAPGGTSANRTSGQVVKNVALKLFSRGMLDNQSTYTEKVKKSAPVFFAGHYCNLNRLEQLLGVTGAKYIKTPQKNTNGTIPSVVGYDVATAVNILESCGIAVKLKGSGNVVSQSIPAGTVIKPGSVITLSLAI